MGEVYRARDTRLNRTAAMEPPRDNSRVVGKPEVMVRSGLLGQLPHSP
jgi:hypothetical protein